MRLELFLSATILILGGCDRVKQNLEREVYGPTACLPDHGDAIVQLYRGDEKVGLPAPARMLAYATVADAIGPGVEIAASHEPVKQFNETSNCVSTAIAVPAQDKSAFIHITWNAKVNHDLVGYAIGYFRRSSADAQDVRFTVKLAQ